MNIRTTEKNIKSHVAEVKRLRGYEHRKKTGRVIVEGYPEVSRAVKAGVKVDALFICPELIGLKKGEFKEQPVVEVTKDVFAQMAFGSRLKGILAICHPDKLSFDDINLKEKALIIVVESVEKPGNLGTIIRSCDGAEVDLLVNCDERTDVFNHNIVRSSIGAVFHVPTVEASKEETYDFLKKNKVSSIAASVKAKSLYYESDLTGPVAILIGNEHDGLSSFWTERADELVRIPMGGVSSSLNAGVSASILAYEACRQRALLSK